MFNPQSFLSTEFFVHRFAQIITDYLISKDIVIITDFILHFLLGTEIHSFFKVTAFGSALIISTALRGYGLLRKFTDQSLSFLIKI